MNRDLARALAVATRDLTATGSPVPTVEVSDWQPAPGAASAMLRSGTAGSARGIWVDTRLPQANRLVMVADQLQEWVIEELAAGHRPTNWPRCEEHPANHPMRARTHAGQAVWSCPRSRRPACEIGRLSGRYATRMSVVAVDERDSGWEQDRPRYRVYLQDGGAGVGGATSTYDLTGVDVLQAVDWAQRQAGDRRTYAVALVCDDHERERLNPGHGRGLVWLVGMDGNDEVGTGSPEWTVQQRMLARRSDPVRLGESDRAPGTTTDD